VEAGVAGRNRGRGPKGTPKSEAKDRHNRRHLIMMHNTLYRLQKNQYKTLVSLSTLFIVLSFIWFIFELFDIKFPFEPVVVLMGGLTTLFAVFWPFRPNYADRRLRAREIFDYNKNDGYFTIGREDLSFELNFSARDDKSIYINTSHKRGYKITVAQGVSKISEIRNIAAFEFSSKNIVVHEGDIACIKDEFGNYACIEISDVKSLHNNVDDKDEVTFFYVINPDKGTDFS
jgi:hypothetical protein